MIGRAPCPECGFSAAHVKQSEKCLYRYCPECQAQYNTRNERQRSDLMAKTRLTEPVETATASAPDSSTATATAGATPAADPVPTATATEPSASTTAEVKPTKRRGLFT